MSQNQEKLIFKQVLTTVALFCLLGIFIKPTFSADATPPQLVDPLMAAPQPKPVPKPEIEDLGNERYRIGSIEVNKASRSFAVSGVVLRIEPPLEFLAVTKGGAKGYESLFELDANAFEFNLACILIGLDPKKGVAPSFHFAPEPAQGDAVGLWISWQKNGKAVKVPAIKLLTEGDTQIESNEWVYTGSMFTPDGQYLAEMDGTLIGFVHDPASVIEHKLGIGLGNYGEIKIVSNLLPAVGERITITVENLESVNNK